MFGNKYRLINFMQVTKNDNQLQKSDGQWSISTRWMPMNEHNTDCIGGPHIVSAIWAIFCLYSPTTCTDANIVTTASELAAIKLVV